MSMPEISFTIVLVIGLFAIFAWWLARPFTPQLDEETYQALRASTEDDGLEELWVLPAADRDGAQ